MAEIQRYWISTKDHPHDDKTPSSARTEKASIRPHDLSEPYRAAVVDDGIGARNLESYQEF